MAEHSLTFTDEELDQFPPQVREALTRMALQQRRAAKPPIEHHPFRVVDRGDRKPEDPYGGVVWRGTRPPVWVPKPAEVNDEEGSA